MRGRLHRTPFEKRIQRLILRFDQEGEEGPRRAIEQIARHGKPAVAILCRELESSTSVRVRRWCVDALGHLAAPKTARYIKAALRDPNMSVRLHAVFAAERLGAPVMGKALLSLVNDPSGGVRINALTAVCRLRVPGASRWVRRAATDEKWYVRLAAVRGIYHLEGCLPSSVVRRLATDPHASLRRAMTTLDATPHRSRKGSAPSRSPSRKRKGQ